VEWISLFRLALVHFTWLAGVGTIAYGFKAWNKCSYFVLPIYEVAAALFMNVYLCKKDSP